MSQTLSPYDFTANHLSRSIFILRGGNRERTRPTFMRTQRNNSVPWPTPASKTYEEVVSKVAAHFYWYVLESRDKLKYHEFICQELMHKSGGRIYKRSDRHSELIEKLNYDQFKVAVYTRLLNFRYKCKDCPGSESYIHEFSTFTPGERVLCDSAANQSFEGTYQYDSVINSNFVYIKFDSRSHVMIWEKRLVRAVDLLLTSGERRVTRQMTRELHHHQRNENAEQNIAATDDASIIEVSDEDTVSVASSVEEERNEIVRNEIDLTNASDSSPSNEEENSAMENTATENAATENTVVDNGPADLDYLHTQPEETTAASNREGNMTQEENVVERNNVAARSNRRENLNFDEIFRRFGHGNAGNVRNINAARNNDADEEIDMSYEGLLRRFGHGNEHQPKLTREWLGRKGFIPCDFDADCAICKDPLPRGTLLYDINCLCFQRQQYRFCRSCMEQFVDVGDSVKCPTCRINLYEEG